MAICSTCADAADNGLSPDAHCGEATCMCGHRPPSRRPATPAASLAAEVSRRVHSSGPRDRP